MSDLNRGVKATVQWIGSIDCFTTARSSLKCRPTICAVSSRFWLHQAEAALRPRP